MSQGPLAEALRKEAPGLVAEALREAALGIAGNALHEKALGSQPASGAKRSWGRCNRCARK
eukprot:7135546-Alexandrium_andersonii.AAC.1